MSRRHTVLSHLALLPVLALTAACAGEEPEQPAAAAPTPAASSSPSALEAASPTAAASSPAPAIPTPSSDPGSVNITFAGGQVSGVENRTVVKVGSPVSIRVTSDVADEVHLHGYDLSVDVGPNQVGELTFTANIPGIFEVELEELGQELTQLQVQ